MKKIDLTVLFWDTVPARIYLALLNKHGYKPSKIIYLDIEKKSKKYNTIKRIFGHSVADYMYKLYTRSKAKPLGSLAKGLLALNDLTKNDLDNCLDIYKNGEFHKVAVENLDDEKLISHIQSNNVTTILFTGGGILNEKLLNIPTAKFIHIHPGIVPDIRGADCFFWSYLLRGKAGYSAFYMNAGIDTGDVLIQREFEVDFEKVDILEYGNDAIYTAILTYHDPCLRIKTFIDLLNLHYKTESLEPNPDKTINLSKLQNEKQSTIQGRMYFFMHKDLRDFVINKLKKHESENHYICSRSVST